MFLILILDNPNDPVTPPRTPHVSIDHIAKKRTGANSFAPPIASTPVSGISTANSMELSFDASLPTPIGFRRQRDAGISNRASNLPLPRNNGLIHAPGVGLLRPSMATVQKLVGTVADPPYQVPTNPIINQVEGLMEVDDEVLVPESTSELNESDFRLPLPKLRFPQDSMEFGDVEDHSSPKKSVKAKAQVVKPSRAKCLPVATEPKPAAASRTSRRTTRSTVSVQQQATTSRATSRERSRSSHDSLEGEDRAVFKKMEKALKEKLSRMKVRGSLAKAEEKLESFVSFSCFCLNFFFKLCFVSSVSRNGYNE